MGFTPLTYKSKIKTDRQFELLRKRLHVPTLCTTVLHNAD